MAGDAATEAERLDDVRAHVRRDPRVPAVGRHRGALLRVSSLLL